MSVVTFPARPRQVNTVNTTETVLIDEGEGETTEISHHVYILSSGTVMRLPHHGEDMEPGLSLVEVRYEILSNAVVPNLFVAGDTPMIEGKRKWKISDFPHLILTSVLGIVGLGDLILYLVSGTTFFHWFNDVLLILSSIGLSITVIMAKIEK